MTKTMALQDQIFSVPVERDKFLVYAPLRKTAFLANPRLLNMICERTSRPEANRRRRAGNNDLEIFESLGLFAPATLPPDPYGATDPSYDAVILFLTNECPLRCVYCYASTGDYAVKKMPWQIAKAAVDFVAEKSLSNPGRGLTLGFHGGGDPALHWNVLKRSVEYARRRASEQGVSLKVTGSFNGYWTRAKLQYILRNFTEVSLSFDGLADIHDLQRPLKNGRGSFSRVVRTIEAMDEAHFPYGIRMTVTKDSVRRLCRSVDFICRRFSPRKIQVEPVFPSGRAGKDLASGVDADEFVSAFLETRHLARRFGVPLFYSGARVDVLTRRFCECAGRALVVTPEGRLTSCFEVFGPEHPQSRRFLIGAYLGRGEFAVDERKRAEFLARSAENDPTCRSCFCKWHCAGDCAAKNEGSPGKDALRCRINRDLTKFLLLERIMENGGLLWNGNKENNAVRVGSDA